MTAGHAEHLHAVTGELVADPDADALMRENEELRTLLKRKQATINGLELRIENLKRDAEAEARRSQIWPVADRLYVVWQKAIGRRAIRKLSYIAFNEVEPHLRDFDPAQEAELELIPATGPPADPFEEVAAAIIGRVSDHFTKTRANGTIKHYWEWERIMADLEESRDRRPRDWRLRLVSYDPGPMQRGPLRV